MTRIRLVPDIDLPVFQQIVVQVRHQVAVGDLHDGDRLPSSRALAEELGINRNTVAKAFAELRDAGLLESHRGGMRVCGAVQARRAAGLHSEADAILQEAVRRCLALGMRPSEVTMRVVNVAVQLEGRRLRVVLVDSKAVAAKRIASTVAQRTGHRVEGMAMEDVDQLTESIDLVITTHDQLAEVRRRAGNAARDVVPIATTASTSVLTRIAALGPGVRVGVVGQSSDLQEVIDVLGRSGVEPSAQFDTAGPFGDVDVVVVPSDLIDQVVAPPTVEVIEFKSDVDEASVRMVVGLLADLRDRPATVRARPRPRDRRRAPHAVAPTTSQQVQPG